MLWTTFDDWNRYGYPPHVSCTPSTQWRTPEPIEVELAVEWMASQRLLEHEYFDVWVIPMVADHLCRQTRCDTANDGYEDTKHLLRLAVAEYRRRKG